MIEDNSPLYKLPPNKTYTFHFRNIPGGRNFVRTGTYSDGNCFIHAVLRCISQEYKKIKDSKIHSELVRRFRKNLGDWITSEIFCSLGQGEYSRIMFNAKFLEIIPSINHFEKNQENKAYSVIAHLLTPVVIEHQIFAKALIESEEKNFYIKFLQLASNMVRQKLTGVLNVTQLNHVISQIPSYFMPIFQEAFDKSLDEYKRRIQTDGDHIDSTQMECISMYTGYNFIFLDGNTLSGYAGGNDVVKFDPNKNTLIFIWVEDNHFEVFGELMEGSVVNRIFSSKDPIIYAARKDTLLEN